MTQTKTPDSQSPVRVLIVEDEPHLATALTIAVQKLQLLADHVSTLAEARVKLNQGLPDLLLLDRTLPDGDGLTLCQEIRKQNSDLAILMLTARGQIQDRVEGLTTGADDYLPKPFAWEELAARIQVLLRRRSLRVPVSAQATGAPWQLDSTRLRVRAARGWVELTPLEFKLAQHLIEADGKIISREMLLKSVWGFSLLPKTRTVDHFMGRLRKHFETDPENPTHFLTVRGAGYRFQR